MMFGKIQSVKFDRGFGFIRDDQWVAYFFHKSACRDGLVFGALVPGDRVSFEFEMTDRGLRATEVRSASGLESAPAALQDEAGGPIDPQGSPGPTG